MMSSASTMQTNIMLPPGSEFQTSIRINSKKYTDAYLTAPDGGSDFLIDNVCDRRGALDGDVVRVSVNDFRRWVLNYNEISLHWNEWSQALLPLINKFPLEDQLRIQREAKDKRLDVPHNLPPTIRLLNFIHIKHLKFCQQCARRTATVIEIVVKRHSRVAGGFLSVHSKTHSLFCPTDHRLPRMLLPNIQCPIDFLTSQKRYKDMLFIARLDEDWLPKSDKSLASGTMLKLVGDKSTLQSKMETLLIEAQINDEDFPQDVYKSLEYLDKLPSNWIEKEAAKRRDLRNECVFTIDPKTARDLDDALSIKDLGKGIYEVGVHIADVSHYVTEMSPVDYHARSRTTSVYLVERVIPMLPRVLCENMCSLNPNEPKLTFSVIWKLDKSGKILSVWFGKTIIESCVKLAYEQAQDMIESADDISWIQPGINMPQLNKFSWEQISKSVNNLNLIARNLRKSRFDNGALKLEQVKIKFELDASSGFPTGFAFENRIESQSLIEEFMLLANISVAKKIYEFDVSLAFLRLHPPSDLKKMKELRDFCEGVGLKFDPTSSATIQKSLDSIMTKKSFAKVVSLLLLKGMINAKYVCAGSHDGDFHHFGLNVPLYTHFTSPIRRYPDIIVHRQLALALKLSNINHEDIHSLTDMANLCTEKKLASKFVSDTSSKLYFGLFLQKAGFCELNACVMKVLDRSFDVILVDYDRNGRIYLDPLKLYIKAHSFSKADGLGRLEITWNATQEIKDELLSNDKSRKSKKSERKKLRQMKQDCETSRIKLETIRQQRKLQQRTSNNLHDDLISISSESNNSEQDSEHSDNFQTDDDNDDDEDDENSLSPEHADEYESDGLVGDEHVYMIDINKCSIDESNRKFNLSKPNNDPFKNQRKKKTIKLFDIIKVYAVADKSDSTQLKLYLKTPHEEFNQHLLLKIR